MVLAQHSILGLASSSVTSTLCDLHKNWKQMQQMTSEQQQHERRVAKELKYAKIRLVFHVKIGVG